MIPKDTSYSFCLIKNITTHSQATMANPSVTRDATDLRNARLFTLTVQQQHHLSPIKHTEAINSGQPKIRTELSTKSFANINFLHEKHGHYIL